MNDISHLSLAPSFTEQLTSDGFKYIGYYEIQEQNVCKIHIEKEPGNWEFSVYTHVSYADGGKHIRIGKCQGPLRARLSSWPRYIGDALNVTMRRNQQFKGGTPPWEAQGWIDYTVAYNRRGLLFAQRVQRLESADATKKALRYLERKFQDRYDPPLCNDTVAGRKLRDIWVTKYGSPAVIKKR
jgi:hypothetical protein